MRTKDRAAILALTLVMLNRGKVSIESKEGYVFTYILQRIDLDGNCDLYSKDYNEVVHEDISFKRLKIV